MRGLLIRVLKEPSVAEVFAEAPGRWRLTHRWPVLAWSGTIGPKLAEGDGQAPEGWYELDERSLRPRSRYHRALDLGFPNPLDRAHGRTGSHLMIHGSDRSAGCYAIGDGPAEVLFDLVAAAVGAGRSVPVLALPFEPTSARLWVERAQRWASHWCDLAAVDHAFQRAGRPPKVAVRRGRYVVVDQSTR